MERKGIASQNHRFGPFEVDLNQRRLTSLGVPVRLQEQPFMVLAVLLEHPGEIVSREDLRQRLWPQGTHVDFEGSLNAVLKRLRAALNDDADRPRYIETIPKRGYRFIAPVTSETAVTPTAPAAPPMPDAVAPVAVSTSVAVPAPRRAPRAVFLMGVLLLALGGFVALRSLGREKTAVHTAAAATTPIPTRKSIAVLGFQNISGRPEDAWLSTALSQMLSTELAAGEKLRIVSGEEIANLRALSPWSPSDTLERKTTSHIGTALNSDLLVLGSYAAMGKSESRQLRVDARLQDAASGEILEEVGEIGSDQDPFRIVSRIGGRMRQRLGMPALSALDEPGIQAALPSNGEAARLYAQGLMKLREFDAAAAKELFLQTVGVDPEFPLGHSMLAQAWGQLGYDQKSREEAKKALDLSANLPRAEKMLVEGAYYESLGDPEKAAATYRALLTLFPDSLDDGIRLLNMLERLGRHEEALETIKQLRRLPPPAGDDPRLDILEAKQISYTSGPESAIVLQRATDKAAARGQKLIYADAKLQACLALQYSEHPEGAIPACQEAYDIFMAAGNRARAASALRNRADATSNEGRKEEALRLYDRAIQMLRESGSRFHLAAAENNKAVLLEQQGHLDQAEHLYQEVRRQFEEIGDKTNMNTALMNIADIQVERGDLETGAVTYEEVIANSQHPDREGYPVYRLASLHYMQGRLKEAHHEAEDAIKMISAGGSYFQGSTEAMEVLGEILKAEGDLAGARHQFEEALATRVKLADPGLIAQSRASLASLAIDEDHPPAAEADLRAVLSEFEKEKDVGNQVAAHIDLSRALQMQGKIEEARKSILFAREASRIFPDPALTLPVAIQDARVKFATAGAGAAGASAMTAIRDQLRSVLTTAHKHGYFTFECEARLALGEIEMRIDPRLGRSDLESLAEETHGRGYELLSRKATALLDPPAGADAGPNATRTR